jgi:DNA-binding YbaB/EbfC family protein
MAMFQQMQAKMLKIQQELGNETVEATAGGGAVSVVMTGQLKVKGVTIDPDAVDPEDAEMLQDLVVAAMNDAIGKAQELQAKRMSALTGGLRIPGIM